MGALFLALPVAGLIMRCDWRIAGAILGGTSVRSALRLSLLVSSLSVILSFLFGFPLAWYLARVRFRGKRLLRILVTLPMVFPPVVAGVALLAALGPRGIIGSSLGAAGIRFPFTTAGAVIAATFVSAPFLILSIESGLRSADVRLEQAAATLGANRWTVLRRIVLPAIRSSLLNGIALTWARALGEFGATITFAGNLEGRTRTLPLAVFQALQTDYTGAVVISVLLLAVALLLLALLGGRFFAS